MPNNLREFRNHNKQGRPDGSGSLKNHVVALSKGREDLKSLNRQIQKQLDLSPNKFQEFTAQVLSRVTPDWLLDRLPEPVARYLAEGEDVLEYLEGALRSNINNIQRGLQELAARAIEKEQDLKKLAADIAQAKSEGWDALQFMEYLAEETGTEIHEEVRKLLTDEYAVISPEEKERRRVEFLQQLESNVVVGGSIMEMLSRVCMAGIQVFYAGMGQYYDYTRVYRDIASIRDAAKDMTDTNRSIQDARDALQITLEKSLHAIGLAVEAATLAERYSITSNSMKGEFENGAQSIKQKLEGLRIEKKNNTPLALSQPAEKEETAVL